MTSALPSSTPAPSSLADQFGQLAELFQAVAESSEPHLRIGEVRSLLADLQAEAESQGMESASRALSRIGLVTELWECLLGDPASSAGEVGAFCLKAATELAWALGRGEHGHEIARWIREQSESRWGEYLELLDTSAAPESEHSPPDEELSIPDDAPAIDAQSLLRLFTGAPPAGSREPQATDDPRRSGVPSGVTDPQPPRLRIPEAPASIDLDDEMREAFLADATDLFERIEPLVLSLGNEASQRDSLHELGRCFHTLKGAAGSVGLSELATLVHGLEEELEDARSAASPELVDLLHETVGYLEKLLAVLRRSTGSLRAEPGAFHFAVGVEPAPQSHPASQSMGMPAAQPAPGSSESSIAVEESTADAETTAPAAADGPIRIAAARFDELMDIVSELIANRRLWTEQAARMESIASLVRNCRNQMLGSLDRLHEAGLGREQASLVIDSPSDVAGQLRRLSERADDLAVLAETAQAAAIPMAEHGDALSRLTIQLWDELQAIRVVAVRGLFQRLIRVAHDAARVEGRKVEVVTVGDETGLDRAVQDKAFEPLLHVVRNAVGHGIEAPADRLKAGKAAMGKITLEARREGNTLMISVRDDGRGLDHAAIAAKARRVGLLAEGEQPSIERLNHMIFRSGFSTKQDVSEISGRGVGMDVVAREVNVQKGTIDLQTEPGQGTRLTIRLPARLALETTMIVRAGGQAYALPVAQIEHAQSFEPDAAQCPDRRGQSQVHTGSVMFRDRRIPMIHVRELLGIASTHAPAWPKLLVVRPGTSLIGLAVDAIEGTEELVIKSLGTLLAGHPVISGTARSVTGEVISILNLSALERWVSEGMAGGSLTIRPTANLEGSPAGSPVLVVDDSISVRRVVARQLRLLGMDVDEVSDGLEALGRLRSRPYRLVVTDLEMPRLDGFELVAEMHRNSALSGIPVIVASTRVDEDTRRRVLALGARAFLPKPVDPAALASTVGPLLERAGC